MPSYAVLLHPGHNRVYFQASRTLARHELSLAAGRIPVKADTIREETAGGVEYLLFETEIPLDAAGLIQLSRLSFVYAIFQTDGEGENIQFKPLLKDGNYYLDESVSRLLKYTGKTNEIFTRFMLNLAAFNLPPPSADITVPRVLDPLCGKGTTIFDCLTLGYHAYGVELDSQLAHEGYVFLKKFLETARHKHESHTEKTGGMDKAGGKFTATRYGITLTGNKIDKKEKNKTECEIIAGDTRYVNTYFRKNTFDMVVGDLPYGVQHFTPNKGKPHGGGTRNALGLLTEALPEWIKVLKPGGVVALAWNLFLIKRPEMENLFTASGLTLPSRPGGQNLSHRVDQAIHRDVIIGVKPL